MAPSRILNLLLSALAAFQTARRGAVAVLFAVMMVPLILATGAAVDFARVEILKTSLQSVVDGAALAGASALSLPNGSTAAGTVATDYFNKGVSSLATTATVGSPTVTIPSSTKVTVTATATLQYSFMKLVASGLSVPITATAQGPAYQLQVTKGGGFTGDAWDGNSIYFYKVSGSTVPTSTASMKLLFTNDPAVDPNWVADNAAAKAIQVGANDSVGFALVNKTGSKTSYSSNGYGAAGGSTHYFYSSLASPSSLAYPSQPTFTTGTTTTTTSLDRYGRSTTTTTCTKKAITTTTTDYVPTNDCNQHPCTTLDNGVVLQNNLVVGSNNACSTPATATKTCLQLQATPLLFAWNDMGGPGDDFDYGDANYTVTCKPVAADGTVTAQPNSVALVN